MTQLILCYESGERANNDKPLNVELSRDKLTYIYQSNGLISQQDYSIPKIA